MINCQEIKQYIIHQDLPDKNISRRIEQHLQVCHTCKSLFQTDTRLDAIIKNAMQSVDPPAGLISRARRRIEAESGPKRFEFMRVSWKTMVPALSMAALVLVMLLNPLSSQLQTVDEVVTHSIANHLDTGMQMAFKAGEVADVGQWFYRHLGYAVHLPDLKQLGLKLLGGRKCGLGKIDAALLFCNSKGKRASLFAIDQNDVAVRFDQERKYTVKQGDLEVTVWKESGMVYAMVI